MKGVIRPLVQARGVRCSKWSTGPFRSPSANRRLTQPFFPYCPWHRFELQRILLHHRNRRHMAADAGDLGGHGQAGAFATRGAGAARQAQPVDLADHRVAGDPAQSPGDLAGREALGPPGREPSTPWSLDTVSPWPRRTSIASRSQALVHMIPRNCAVEKPKPRVCAPGSAFRPR